MRRGFSILELSIVLAVSALVAIFVYRSYAHRVDEDCYTTTRDQIYAIKDALQGYAVKNSRLPMPASRMADAGDAGAGHEVSDISAITQTAGVSFGALPFEALGLAPSFGADCWGNKFTYVVTTALTKASKRGGYADPTVPGNIIIRGSATTVTSPTGAYAAISHGADQLGAVSAGYDGGDPRWCIGGALRHINCSADGNNVAAAIFSREDSSAPDFFDDLVIAADKPAAAGLPCTLPWGGEIPSGSRVTAYTEAEAAERCTPEVRICTNGELSGKARYGACLIKGAGCTMTVDGKQESLTDGQSIMRYQYAIESVYFSDACPRPPSACPSACTQRQMATCRSGRLIGNNPITFTKSECRVNCTPDPGCTASGGTP
jgi:prepilin-type N-terminal cleavage/methylation domain-containing protein